MRDLFHGWRRKIGSVTLVMTLALLVVWMRSRITFDVLGLDLSDATYWLCMDGNRARFSRETPSRGGPLLNWRTRKLADFEESEDLDEWAGVDVEWRRDYGDFHIGAGKYSFRRIVICVLPYWSLVLPLTVLSGSLILTKPRKPSTPVLAAKTGQQAGTSDCAN